MILPNKVFKGMAETGKSSMGWFYGFKLHLICNDKGELLNFCITKGNIDDRNPFSMESFIRNVSDKLYADRGYISQKLAEILFVEETIYQG